MNEFLNVRVGAYLDAASTLLLQKHVFRLHVTMNNLISI